MNNLYLNEVITSVTDLSNHYVFRDGYAFTSIDEHTNVYDAIIIRFPPRAQRETTRMPVMGHSPEEHIALINEYKLEKAKIIAEDISFIRRCPTLKYLDIAPADTAPQNFDYSPLYEMPEIHSLTCQTHYGGLREPFSTTVDCARIRGLKDLFVRGTGYLNVDRVETLENLFVSSYPKRRNLNGLVSGKHLKKLTFLSCNFESLDGIEAFSHLQSLNIWYNRTLSDISALHHTAPSLRGLSIENCPKITDFSALSSLTRMEALSLEGKNDIPDLNFLNHMKSLRFFTCTMNVADGDLTSCLSVPYVDIRGRKHYNLKNKDLPKQADPRGFSLI